MAAPDSWSNIAKIAIQVAGGSYIQFGARTSDIDINEGDRGYRGEPSVDGSRIGIDEPQSDGTVTLTMRPIDLDTTSSDGGLFQQYRGGTFDTSDPLITDDDSITGSAASSTLVRLRYRIVVLWTNDVANTIANGSVTAGQQGLRFFANNCRIVSNPSPFTNKDLITTVTFKFTPRTVGNIWNYDWQSCTTAALVALGNFT